MNEKYLREIDFSTFRKLFDRNEDIDFWFSDDYIVDEKGFRPRPVDEKAMRLLHGEELDVIYEFRKDIVLKFPCTVYEMIDWAERNGFSDMLPDGFISDYR
jgi:hypothetical protein